MQSPIKMGTDYSPVLLRVFTKSARTKSQSRRLLSLARCWMAWIVLRLRASAAWIGIPCGAGFTGSTSSALTDCAMFMPGGVEPGLSADQKAELAAFVDAGPDFSVDGVVRWRPIDLQRVIKECFGVEDYER
jgi:hypothetical protein